MALIKKRCKHQGKDCPDETANQRDRTAPGADSNDAALQFFSPGERLSPGDVQAELGELGFELARFARQELLPVFLTQPFVRAAPVQGGFVLP